MGRRVARKNLFLLSMVLNAGTRAAAAPYIYTVRYRYRAQQQLILRCTAAAQPHHVRDVEGNFGEAIRLLHMQQ
jgi:hypothetical protein